MDGISAMQYFITGDGLLSLDRDPLFARAVWLSPSGLVVIFPGGGERHHSHAMRSDSSYLKVTVRTLPKYLRKGRIPSTDGHRQELAIVVI